MRNLRKSIGAIKMQKIVTLGGGTGHFQLLRGLKNYDCNITAIVNVSDDGGSSGKLRDEYGILPPGDLRQCIVALADNEHDNILRKLFNYRFKNGEGHNFGNLIITALTDICGNTQEAIKETCKLMRVRGRVLPVSIDNAILHAETLDGKILNGQTNISYPAIGTKIKKVFYKPDVFVYKEVSEAIKNADKIVICPGDLYGSILPVFITKGFCEALKQSKAKKIYVCNLFTKEGNENFRASDFLREIENYAGLKLDHVILNTKKPSEEVMKKYLSENSKFVEDDLPQDNRIIRGDFVAEYPSESKTIFRHVPEKIARVIVGL